MQSIEISEMYSKHWKAKRATLTFQTEIHKHSNKWAFHIESSFTTYFLHLYSTTVLCNDKASVHGDKQLSIRGIAQITARQQCQINAVHQSIVETQFEIT